MASLNPPFPDLPVLSSYERRTVQTLLFAVCAVAVFFVCSPFLPPSLPRNWLTSPSSSPGRNPPPHRLLRPSLQARPQAVPLARLDLRHPRLRPHRNTLGRHLQLDHPFWTTCGFGEGADEDLYRWVDYHRSDDVCVTGVFRGEVVDRTLFSFSLLPLSLRPFPSFLDRPLSMLRVVD